MLSLSVPTVPLASTSVRLILSDFPLCCCLVFVRVFKLLRYVAGCCFFWFEIVSFPLIDRVVASIGPRALKVSCAKCGNGLGHEFLGDGPQGGSRF